MHIELWEALAIHHLNDLARQVLLLLCFFDDRVFGVCLFRQRRVAFDKLNDAIRLALAIRCLGNKEDAISITLAGILVVTERLVEVLT